MADDAVNFVWVQNLDGTAILSHFAVPLVPDGFGSGTGRSDPPNFGGGTGLTARYEWNTADELEPGEWTLMGLRAVTVGADTVTAFAGDFLGGFELVAGAVLGPVSSCSGAAGATITSSVPPDGTLDARQPHPVDNADQPQGIGSYEEPIIVDLGAGHAGLSGCFTLCESLEDSDDENAISSVAGNGAGQYTIRLSRPITVDGYTTLQFKGDGSSVHYISQPANINADDVVTVLDLLTIIDHLNANPGGAGLDPYLNDVDRSGAVTTIDLIRVADLMTGAGAYEARLGSELPEYPDCP